MADAALPDGQGLFVLDARVSDSPVRPKARVVLDGDEGVGIDECARVSRAINRQLEELPGEEASYVLEVTSPGADQPLTLPRQFPRHIGRMLAITRQDGTTVQGELRAASADALILAPEAPKRGKYKQTAAEVGATNPASIEIFFADIKSAIVVISFK
ncbi:MAG: ribosome maturation factor [Hymenobacteraceae bacterium]|nr:ribosome maturation factor [Hymenobacteraceae bacterium]